MHRFYVPGFLFGRELPLPADEAQHLSRVLRLKAGDTVAIFDGKGGEASARVVAAGSKGVIVKALEPREPAQEPKIRLTLAQALLKSDKMDRVIRDAVMLGVAAIQPFVSSRTDVPRAALRSGVRRERWDRTVLSSVKQCGRAVVPLVHDAHDFGALLRDDTDHLRLMLVEPSSARTHSASAIDLRGLEARPPASAIVIVGPEGGWDPEEIEAAARAGVTLITLGSRTLRADAAAAVAIPVLQYVWRDL